MADFSAYGEIDRVVHEPGRLMILAVLSSVEEADFRFLQGQTALTKGNLSSHVSKLEGAEYVEVSKTFVGKVPRTVYRITKRGQDALDDYRSSMSGILSDLADPSH